MSLLAGIQFEVLFRGEPCVSEPRYRAPRFWSRQLTLRACLRAPKRGRTLDGLSPQFLLRRARCLPFARVGLELRVHCNYIAREIF